MDTSTSQPLGSTSARLVAVKLKTANKSIFKALLSLASANLLIRIMGLLNQVFVTTHFGLGKTMDAYFVALTVPAMLASLISSGIEGSVIPTYARVRTKEAKEKASKLFSTMLNILIIASIFFTVLMLIFSKQLVIATAPGDKGEFIPIAVALAPFIFPQMALMVINSFMESLLNAEGKFGWPAYAGLLAPLTTAIFVIIGGPRYGVVMLCLGTMVGQVLQLFVIILRARQAKIAYRPIIDLHMPELHAVWRMAWPSLLGSLVSLASPYVDTVVGSYQVTGVISALNYANRLNGVPTGVISAAAGRAALPYLSNQAAIKDWKGFKATLRLYLWGVTIATGIVSVGMILFGHLAIRILFQHGSFTAQATDQTASILTGLAIGLVPMTIGFVLAKAFTALGKARFLTGVSIFSVFLNAILDVIFARPWGGFGIALATSVYYMCTMVILLVGLRLELGPLNLLTPPRELLGVIWRFGLGEYYIKWITWREENLVTQGIGLHAFYKQVSRVVFALVIFAAGVAGTIANDVLTLRIALGSTLVLVFLRYQYFLLLACAGINVFIGSTLPLFNGNNLLSGLTLPLLLLLFYLPVKKSFKLMPALAILLAFQFWILFSIGFSPLPVATFLTNWTTRMDLFAVSVLVVLVITTRKRLLLLVDLILLPAVFISGYGIWGYLTRHGGVVDTSTGYFRIASIFGNVPPTLALYLSIIIPFTVYRIFTVRGARVLPYLGMLLLFLAALGLTFDRGSQISVPLGAIVMLFFLPSKQVRGMLVSAYAFVGVLVVAVAIFLKLPIFSRFFNQDLTTLNGRTLLWKAILDHFDPTKLLGSGYSASDQLLLNLKVGFGGGVIATVAHNIYLETMYDQGLIGLGMLIALLLVIAAGLLKRWRGGSYDHKLLIAMAIWAFVNVCIQSAESNDIWNESVGLYFFILMALPFAVYWIKDRENEAPRTLVAEAGPADMIAAEKDRQEQLTYA